MNFKRLVCIGVLCWPIWLGGCRTTPRAVLEYERSDAKVVLQKADETAKESALVEEIEPKEVDNIHETESNKTLADLSRPEFRESQIHETHTIDREQFTHLPPPPLTSDSALPSDSIRLTLDEAIALALRNTKILRGVSAQILERSEFAPGSFDPSLTATDPATGIEAALSEFDANLLGGFRYSKNDSVFNNVLSGGGTNEVKGNSSVANFELHKTAATGTRFSLRGNVLNDDNDRPVNLFNNSWTTLLEAEARQPLLRGRGIRFNRIAGPNSHIANGFNGVMLSRIDTTISLAQFERSVTEFVDEVVLTYWKLYFAYRNFESLKAARESAAKAWNVVKCRMDNDLPGGEAYNETQARELYFDFEERLRAALNGDTFNGTVGILQAEADLRRLLDLPQSGDKLIRPIDEPIVAKTVYDWNRISAVATAKRVELVEQSWRVRKNELELIAAKHFTMPRLDLVGIYRNNGFGDNLIGDGNSRFSGAVNTAFRGDYDEWEFGLQYSAPIGNRRARVGVRNAEILLRREKSLLEQQRKEILHELGTAIRQSNQSFHAIQISSNRLQASRETVQAQSAAFEADSVPFRDLLDSQQRLIDSETNFYRETVNYALANHAVIRESGQMLSNYMIYLTEMSQYHTDYAQDFVYRSPSQEMDYRFTLSKNSAALNEKNGATNQERSTSDEIAH